VCSTGGGIVVGSGKLEGGSTAAHAEGGNANPGPAACSSTVEGNDVASTAEDDKIGPGSEDGSGSGSGNAGGPVSSKPNEARTSERGSAQLAVPARVASVGREMGATDGVP